MTSTILISRPSTTDAFGFKRRERCLRRSSMRALPTGRGRMELVRLTDLFHQLPVECDCPIPGMGVSVAPPAQIGKLTNRLSQNHGVVWWNQDRSLIVGNGRREASDGGDDKWETVAHRDMGGRTG